MKELAGLLNDVIGTKRDALEDAVTDNQARIAQSKQRLQKANISNELLTRAGQTLIQVQKDSCTLDDYNAYVRIGILALAHAKATDQALYCINQNIIPITEEIADLLTPEGDLQDEENKQTVKTIGKLLFKAELYVAAVKKFISIGESYLALQSLIKLGDINKIVKFAQMSRSRECFIAAANFLQT